MQTHQVLLAEVRKGGQEQHRAGRGGSRGRKRQSSTGAPTPAAPPLRQSASFSDSRLIYRFCFLTLPSLFLSPVTFFFTPTRLARPPSTIYLPSWNLRNCLRPPQAYFGRVYPVSPRLRFQVTPASSISCPVPVALITTSSLDHSKTLFGLFLSTSYVHSPYLRSFVTRHAHGLTILHMNHFG